MAIGFVGDIHGAIGVLLDIVKTASEFPDVKAVIQVGDFGVRNIKNVNPTKYAFPLPTYYIEGNHEYFEEYEGIAEVTEILPNLFFVPRGTVLEIDGRTVAFFGGAASIDKKYRLAQKLHWDNRENITPEQDAKMSEACKDKKIDIFVSHVPPQRVIKAHFDDMGKLAFGVGIDWEDPNAFIIERHWDAMGNPMNISGHMHRKVNGQNYRILDIMELWTY